MTKTTAIYLGSLALLLVAVLASARAGRDIGVQDFPLDRIPPTFGDWRVTQQKTPSQAKDEGEALLHYRTYRSSSDRAVSAVIKVTSSRIGSMRDYGTVMIGQGWTLEQPSPWDVDLTGVPFKAQVRSQTLRQGPRRMYTLNWYVSPGAQAFTLEQAVMAGWRQRAVGVPLWGQVYLSTASKQQSPEAQQALEGLARELLPAFYEALCDYGRRAPGTSPSGERT